MGFWDKAFSYLEKLLPPIQFWLVSSIISGMPLYLPEDVILKFGLSDIFQNYRGYFVLVFFTSILVFIITILSYFIKYINLIFVNFKNIQTVNTSKLNDEEKAILCFFINNKFRGATLNKQHPSIMSLKERNFIEVPYSPIIYIDGSEYEYLELTKVGKKKIQSTRFQKKHLKNIKQDKILDFINAISKQEYSQHIPRNFN